MAEDDRLFSEVEFCISDRLFGEVRLKPHRRIAMAGQINGVHLEAAVRQSRGNDVQDFLADIQSVDRQNSAARRNRGQIVDVRCRRINWQDTCFVPRFDPRRLTPREYENRGSHELKPKAGHAAMLSWSDGMVASLQ